MGQGIGNPSEIVMDTVRSVRLFRFGPNQVVPIPRDWELPGPEALISREGDAVVVRPSPARSLLATLRTWAPLAEDLPAIPALPAEPVDL